MNNAKKLKSNAELSANDVLAKRFVDLAEKAAKINKELKELKKQWGHGESFNTRHYMVVVEKTKRLKLPNRDEGVAMFGEKFLKACSESTVTTVKVTKKGA